MRTSSPSKLEIYTRPTTTGRPSTPQFAPTRPPPQGSTLCGSLNRSYWVVVLDRLLTTRGICGNRDMACCAAFPVLGPGSRVVLVTHRSRTDGTDAQTWPKDPLLDLIPRTRRWRL